MAGAPHESHGDKSLDPYFGGRVSALGTAGRGHVRDGPDDPYPHFDDVEPRVIDFSLLWRTDAAVTLASQMYESRDFSAMPILADALQGAGYDNAEILDHCRGPGPHVRGGRVVDSVLDPERGTGLHVCSARLGRVRLDILTRCTVRERRRGPKRSFEEGLDEPPADRALSAAQVRPTRGVDSRSDAARTAFHRQIDSCR